MLSPKTIKILTIKDLDLLEYPHWNTVLRVYHELKEYESGAELTMNLITRVQALGLEVEPQHARRIEDALSTLWLAHLNFLDMADKWDDYINAYDYLLKNRPRTFETDLSGRYRLIKKKSGLSKAGRPVGNFLHKQKRDLTRVQQDSRYEWAKRQFNFFAEDLSKAERQ